MKSLKYHFLATLLLSLDVLSVLIVFAVFVNGIYILTRYDAPVWVNFIVDDGYYYLGIARNLVENGISSFLPPFHTNGYQPLWLMILWVSAYIFGTSETGLVVQDYILTFIFIFIFLWLSRKHYKFVFPAVSFALGFTTHSCGMETVMMPVFLILFLKASSWQWRGVLGALLFLTRLDALAVVIISDIYGYYRRKEINLKHYIFIVPCLLVYVLINYHFFGVPVPVSGLAKSVGNAFGENRAILINYTKNLLIPMVFLGLAYLAVIRHKLLLSDFKYLDEIVLLTISTIAVMVYYWLFSGWSIWYWYLWLTYIINFFIVLECLNFLLNGENGFNLKSSVVSVVMAAALFYSANPAFKYAYGSFNAAKNATHGSPGMTFAHRNIELVKWITQNKIPDLTFFAMGDRAGSFGYFLGNHYQFLHTEGLVASADYYKAMKSDKALEFIDGLHIKYWIADRGKYLVSRQITGVIEPIQGLSAHKGVYMVCFDNKGIVLDQSYLSEKRYIFDTAYRVDCPSEMVEKFEQLRQRYGGVNNFSLSH